MGGKALLLSVFILFVLPGCGGDSSEEAAPPGDVSAPSTQKVDLAHLVAPDCSLEKFRAGLGGLVARDTALLDQRLREVIAAREDELGRKTVEIQRLPTDALIVDEDARALKDGFQQGKSDLELLKKKLLVLAILRLKESPAK